MSNNKTKKLPTNSSKICRFCLANDSETIDLFDELAINMNCIEIISNHFWFTVSRFSVKYYFLIKFRLFFSQAQMINFPN